MQKKPNLTACLSSLAVLLMLVGGCGQNEGGRCQVDSDCGSGLFCDGGNTGNGKCRAAGISGTGADAAIASKDVADDLMSVVVPEDAPFTPEVELVEVGAEAAMDDAPAFESGASETGAVDSGGNVDSGGID